MSEQGISQPSQSQDASMPAQSTGLRWALAMLLLQIAEVLALTEVIFGDRPARGVHPQFGALEIYFGVVIVSVILQVAGIMLVRRARYRLGGALQIAASSVHLVKIEGFLGMVGGLRAWKYRRDPGVA